MLPRRSRCTQASADLAGSAGNTRQVTFEKLGGKPIPLAGPRMSRTETRRLIAACYKVLGFAGRPQATHMFLQDVTSDVTLGC